MKKKSKYKPKRVYLNALEWVISGLKPLNKVDDEAVKIKIKNHDAMLKLTQGTADLLDMDTLVKASNMSISLERSQKLGTDWRDELEAAKQALIAVIERGQKTARYVCKGSEMSAINLMMEIHDAQLDNATVSMLEKALVYINNRRSGGDTVTIHVHQ